jgi:hypothetical protein
MNVDNYFYPFFHRELRVESRGEDLLKNLSAFHKLKFDDLFPKRTKADWQTHRAERKPR